MSGSNAPNPDGNNPELGTRNNSHQFIRITYALVIDY